jgi:hypothetical protein
VGDSFEFKYGCWWLPPSYLDAIDCIVTIGSMLKATSVCIRKFRFSTFKGQLFSFLACLLCRSLGWSIERSLDGFLLPLQD